VSISSGLAFLHARRRVHKIRSLLDARLMRSRRNLSRFNAWMKIQLLFVVSDRLVEVLISGTLSPLCRPDCDRAERPPRSDFRPTIRSPGRNALPLVTRASRRRAQRNETGANFVFRCPITDSVQAPKRRCEMKLCRSRVHLASFRTRMNGLIALHDRSVSCHAA